MRTECQRKGIIIHFLLYSLFWSLPDHSCPNFLAHQSLTPRSPNPPNCSLAPTHSVPGIFMSNLLPDYSLPSIHQVPGLLSLPYKYSPRPLFSHFWSSNIWAWYYVEHTSNFSTQYRLEYQSIRDYSSRYLCCILVVGFHIWEEEYLRLVCRFQQSWRGLGG